MKRYSVERQLGGEVYVTIIIFSGWDSKSRAKSHAARLVRLLPDIKFVTRKVI